MVESPRAVAWEIAAALTVGLWFAVIGPFGSYNSGPLGTRLLCFLLMSPVLTALYGAVCRVAIRAGEDRGLSPWISLPAAITALSIPMSWAIASWVPLFLPRARFASPLEWYAQVLAVMLPTGLAILFLRQVLARPAVIRETAEGPRASRLTARLRAGMGLDVLALQAEDHYVRVHTAAGSDLILMRLSDAIDELDGLAGVQVHRSWWVANNAVTASSAKGRNLTLCLSNDLEVPVSRTGTRVVRDAGWTGPNFRRRGTRDQTPA